MSVSRRKFLQSSTMAALVGGVLLESPIRALAHGSGSLLNYFQIPEAAQKTPVFHYGRSTFEPYVGGIFIARNAQGEAIRMRLDRVKGYTPNPKTKITTSRPGETECFSLIFEASSGLPPFSSIQAIQHPKLGMFNLFLTKVDAGSHTCYQAVVHRVV